MQYIQFTYYTQCMILISSVQSVKFWPGKIDTSDYAKSRCSLLFLCQTVHMELQPEFLEGQMPGSRWYHPYSQIEWCGRHLDPNWMQRWSQWDSQERRIPEHYSWSNTCLGTWHFHTHTGLNQADENRTQCLYLHGEINRIVTSVYM